MKRLKQVHIVHVIILLLFAITIASKIYSYIEVIEFYGDDSVNKLDYFFQKFRPIIIVLLPVIAIFYRSKLSWFLILIYFYLILCNTIMYHYLYFDTMFLDFSDLLTIMLSAFYFLLPLISLYLLNRFCTYNVYYSIDKVRISLYNFLAFILGGGLSLLFFIQNNSHYYEGLEL